MKEIREAVKMQISQCILQVILAYAVFASTDMNLFFNELTRPFIFQICKEKQARGDKTFSMLNSAEHEIILLINVKMQTIVGILTFISMTNTTSLFVGILV